MNKHQTMLMRGLVLAVLTSVTVLAVAQSISDIGRAAGFSTDLYYRAPDNQKIRARLFGAQTFPLEGGLLEVKEFRLEEFDRNGAMRVKAQAPTCTFDQFAHEAHSAGHILMQDADGKFRVEADGFSIIYRNAENMTLVLSNRVRTVIDSAVLNDSKKT